MHDNIIILYDIYRIMAYIFVRINLRVFSNFSERLARYFTIILPTKCRKEYYIIII